MLPCLMVAWKSSISPLAGNLSRLAVRVNNRPDKILQERRMITKETWEMNREEFYKWWAENRALQSGLMYPQQCFLPEKRFMMECIRKGYILHAVVTGKAVPQEIIAEYPTLLQGL
jgi:hypothetical protein